MLRFCVQCKVVIHKLHGGFKTCLFSNSLLCTDSSSVFEVAIAFFSILFLFRFLQNECNKNLWIFLTTTGSVTLFEHALSFSFKTYCNQCIHIKRSYLFFIVVNEAAELVRTNSILVLRAYCLCPGKVVGALAYYFMRVCCILVMRYDRLQKPGPYDYILK